LLPFKRYSANEIEASLHYLEGGGSLAQAPGEADERTLQRWKKEFQVTMQDWAGQLEAVLWQLKQRISSIIRLSLKPFHRLQAALSEYAELPSDWTLLVKTLYWLQKAHPRCLG
jgi:hypothetical protein